MAAREQSGTNVESPAFCARLGGIYEIANSVSGRRYVGSTTHFKRRWSEHRKMLRAGNHRNAPLQSAWKKYGEAVFRFTVLAVLEDREIIPTEQRLLAQARSVGERVYNIAVDATSGMKGRNHSAQTRALLTEQHRQRACLKPPAPEKVQSAAVPRSQETIAKHRESLKAYYADQARRKQHAERMKAFYETPQGQASIAKVAQAKRGVAQTQESNAKRAAAMLGQRRGPEFAAKVSAAKLASGYTHTDETRANIGRSGVGRKQSPETIAKRVLATTATKKAKHGLA